MFCKDKSQQTGLFGKCLRISIHLFPNIWKMIVRKCTNTVSTQDALRRIIGFSHFISAHNHCYWDRNFTQSQLSASRRPLKTRHLLAKLGKQSLWLFKKKKKSRTQRVNNTLSQLKVISAGAPQDSVSSWVLLHFILINAQLSVQRTMFLRTRMVLPLQVCFTGSKLWSVYRSEIKESVDCCDHSHLIVNVKVIKAW